MVLPAQLDCCDRRMAPLRSAYIEEQHPVTYYRSHRRGSPVLASRCTYPAPPALPGRTTLHEQWIKAQS